VLAVLGAIAALGVLAAGGMPAPATAVAAGTPRCTTAGLDIWLNTAGNGTAGSIFYNLQLTNLSGHACTLSGYPRVAAVNLAGRQIGRESSREAVQKARVLTLKNGASAIAVLRIVDAANFPAAACREVTAAGLRVRPPGQRASRLVPFPFRTCSRTRIATLAVRAVQ
jgi:hypothetical protein